MNASEAIFNRLVSGRKRVIRKEEALFHQGDAVENIYVVRRGRIKLIRSTIDGNPVVLQLAMAGEIIAESSLFSDTYHCAAVVDSPSAELSCFDRHGLLAAFRKFPAAAMEIAELFAHRIRKLRALLEIRNIRSARQRIYAWLQLEPNDENEVPLRLSFKDMAYQLGLAHETFYRELKKLEGEEKIIRKEHAIQLR
ncbi:MAG: Crp/Fnr family transcriptional regulator [Mariprofundaceae bacterium]|nr:Crp/Fnr family transcriptional regulator [Mariprofundaceae bacterium]